VTPPLDIERCYRAVAGRDARFDGWFFTAVHTTGIYCRPSCPARTPLARNVSFFTTAAGAQAAGFRACRRCRPDAVPGSPEWDIRADVVARAMRLIADGEVERSGVPGLAARLGYSERQLHRLLVAELGVGSLALARAQRARTARVLIETTDLPMADVAFAAGFASIRQFNDTVHEVFAATPTALRHTRRGGGDGGAAGWLTLRLAARAPYEAAEVLLFLGAHAVPGLEEWDGTTFSRVLDLPRGPAVVQLSPAPDGGPAVTARLRLTELRDLGAAVTRCRRMLDLDADPVAVDDLLGSDPALAPLVTGAPGRRVPASPDADELAVRAVLGQQVSVAGARTLTARLLAAGTPLPEPVGTLTHAFPRAAALADADLSAVGLTGARRRTVAALTAALASGDIALDPGTDREEAGRALLAVPGIGPWTAALVGLRGLADPDVWLPGDLALRRSLATLGSSDSDAADRWRPWRSYAVLHLWALAVPSLFTRPTTPLTRGPALPRSA
jgi:AraC family transcriptional regulator of adaptative response / DNA-3-methyladenine glycosylase II